MTQSALVFSGGTLSVIFFDCYDGDGLIPPPLRTRNFLESCEILLKPGGTLVDATPPRLLLGFPLTVQPHVSGNELVQRL